MQIAEARLETNRLPPTVAFVGADESTPYDQIAQRFASAGVSLRHVSTLGGADDAAVSILCCQRVQGEALQARYLETGAFNQHDFTATYRMGDDVTLRAGVVNAFDEESAPWLGRHSADNFDFFGRRYFMSVNYKV